MTPKIHDAATVKAAKRNEQELLHFILGNIPEVIARCWAGDLSKIAGLEAKIKELSEWRSMETAPKDGTRILAIGYAYGDKAQGYHTPVVTYWENGWVEENDENDESYPYLTGWLPLPEAPQQKT